MLATGNFVRGIHRILFKTTLLAKNKEKWSFANEKNENKSDYNNTTTEVDQKVDY